MSTLAVPMPGPAIQRRLVLRSFAVLALCVLASLLAWWLRPTKEIAVFSQSRLESVVPAQFGDWKIDPYVRPVIPDPSLLNAMSRIYSETLARTYVNGQGQRIMLSLAYGRRQNDTMRLHQPEGCYTGQGFGVRQLGQGRLDLGGRAMPVTRLHATLGSREEPVTYWMVVGGEHAVTQMQMKFAQLHFGLRGYVPDGLLFRVSSIGTDSAAGFALQDQFVRDLLSAVPPEARAGLTGS